MPGQAMGTRTHTDKPPTLPHPLSTSKPTIMHVPAQASIPRDSSTSNASKRTPASRPDSFIGTGLSVDLADYLHQSHSIFYTLHTCFCAAALAPSPGAHSHPGICAKDKRQQTVGVVVVSELRGFGELGCPCRPVLCLRVRGSNLDLGLDLGLGLELGLLSLVAVGYTYSW